MKDKIREKLVELGWIFDEDEDTCVAFVKGDYDLWYFPEENYLEIENSKGFCYIGNPEKQEGIIEIVKDL